ncbi:hypothetical protein GCM10010912_36740 [Paenibacillus albidus]|uniref:Bacterial EndoU nuclease domain-containing protein n=1 Tax=Paenibacillus albidus TaxID=2041023 RepID=A0A917FLT6_9BACL|nr:EndoU domain-containing protein [Paenibacillus albidus]GGF88128.1 hypothetical protein GCM10010912_36740 [Paenibacillus albidus]
MQQKVELNRLLELEQGVKRLNRTLEEQVTGMHKAVSEQVRSAQSAYPESSDVRSPAQELEQLLRETRDLAASISSRLYQKETTLRWAVGQYQSTEKQARNLIKAPPSFTWKQTSTLFSKWLQTARDRAAGGLQDLLRSTPTLFEMIKDLLWNVRDASLDKRLQPFVDEAKIASLLEQRDHGSPEEQQEAREQLARIAEALDEIGRSQVAYGIYEKYGNVEYMELAGLHAEQQRQLLQELGVDPGLYRNVDLRSQYKGSPLSACTYNPLQKDRSAVPANEELRLVIALGLVNDKYREWAKTHYEDIEQAVKRAEVQRELERQMAEWQRLNEPPTTLPDGTPITAENKRNDTTRAYYKEKVMDGEYRKLLGYNDWLEETYGMTEWRNTMDQTDKVINAFVGGFVESTVMAVVDTVQFAFEFAMEPDKMSQEMMDKANYIYNNPDVIVEAAKTMYKNFEEGTPEEQAKMLGEAASILVPGVQIAKARILGKVADSVLDPLWDAAKNFNIPEIRNPFKNQMILDTPGIPGSLNPNQVWKVEGNGRGGTGEGREMPDDPPPSIDPPEGRGNASPIVSVVSKLGPEVEKKILEGQRITDSNKLIGGHSPNINNANPKYAVQEIRVNPDGTRSVKFTTQFPDGNLSKIKTSTLYPESWSDAGIINSINIVGDSPVVGIRSSEGLTLHRGTINGVEIEVIKHGNDIISGFPVGGKPTTNFDPLP